MNLSQRILEGELMDDPALDADRHESALKGLRRVNLWSGTASVLVSAIEQHFEKSDRRPLQVLDLACGGGDVSIQLVKKLAAAGRDVQLVGWDRSPTAIEIATHSANRAGLRNVRFEVHDVLADDFGKGFDVIICTLFLHHLSLNEGAKLLSKMHEAAQSLVLIDDLRRTRTGLFLAHLACRVLTRSPIVRVDGPMSVRAAFQESEVLSLAEGAGLPRPSIKRHWPQRFLLQWSRA